MSYKPAFAPQTDNPRDIVRWAYDEFRKIGDALELARHIDAVHGMPVDTPRLPAGMVKPRYDLDADVLYVYNGTGWVGITLT